ncbi:MAG: hypothetical protein ACD_2C00266G0009 [uncultured bacterium (gcode 4)]|uniref:CYTH domain-containing protein n=1 Tax=uncultured bacterium (gcode 4) TaxID=1234023 RepID=K2G0Z4_9BACT|nr:MAG: hypothetical protein ACD_2C00266G0009 [uncultured bacterium (gcode 4)]
MAIEYEVKVLDIDVPDIRHKLELLWANGESEKLMRRWVFVMNPEINEWIRLRDDWDKISVTYKKKSGQKIDETEEIEVIVEDFEKTAEILNKLDFKEKYYQENSRKNYILGDIEFSIDSWPKIPPLLEVESDSEVKVLEWLKMLWLAWKHSWNLSTVKVYDMYGLDLHSFKSLKF